ncbi:DUF5977 domain-containing protein [Flavobacterium tructae]|uniref:DUF5977 domain-containing protein n=1 Tax=Flavobacterium tructae TaxID=1114873 RepID=UPI0013FDE88E|nr:DUF5977 domain-containing protein [Flavobacterium tructae]
MLFSFEIFAQNNAQSAPQIIPPSPTAYELGRYGQADVGTFTGTPNISVPLYTYKTKNIAIPISLNYNSNGIQVDQMETNVGLGWNLNTGGIINRIVRGKDDDERTASISEDMYCSDNFFAYIENNQFNDTQPDMYSYNFQGQSGQFVFDNNGKAVLVSQNNLKIEKLGTSIKSGFKITTEDGVEYQFTSTEYSTWENVEAPQTVATGWYLTKIIHPEGDVVNFTYKDSNYSFISNISESFGIKISEGLNCLSHPFQGSSNRSENHLNVMGKTIESISSTESQYGSVSFQLKGNPNLIGNFLIEGIQVFDAGKLNVIEKADFKYLFTADKRIFLTECIFKDPSKKYGFEYDDPNGLVARLSDQRDLWGYYNGKSGTYPDAVIHKNLYPQTDLVKNALMGRSYGDKRPYVDFAKKGILKRVVYPTKGYNDFEYEANSVWGTVISDCEIELKNIPFYNPLYDREQKTGEFVFESKADHETEILARVFYNDYEFTEGTFPVGELWLTVKVENLTNPQLSSFPITADEHNKPKKLPYTFLKNNSYKISVTFSPDAKTTGQVNFTYCKGGGVESKANIPVAGLRIAKITSFDTASNKADVKHYYYGKKESRFTSTGVEGIPINLISFSEQRAFCDKNTGLPNYWNIETWAKFININANSIYPLYRSMGNSSTTYEYVTVSHGGPNFENGGEEFQYYISADIPPYLCLDSYLTSAPWVNLSWKNGLLHIKKVFNKNLDDLSIVENQYKLEDQYTRKIPGVAIEIKYNALYHFTSPNYKNIEHLNISKYTTNSYWFYLESESNTQYDVKGSNPVTTITTYKYNNPSHLKLSSQSTTVSKQEVADTKATTEIKYFYPSDSEMVSEPFRNELMAKNMIGKVLDTQVFKQEVKLSEQKTVYEKSAATSNLLLPRSVYANKGASSIDLSLDKKITYDQYDDKGNILQYTLESGIPVSIIWGYNKTQPIAKIENVVYNLIPSATIASLQTLSNADIDNCLSDNCTEQKLREGLKTLISSLPNAFISSYTYNPLVGVTSVTDPKGIPSYYEYDSFGRLKFVKDQDLNILQKYCYNYKGQQTDCSDNTSTSDYLYKSVARSGSFTKKNCPVGGVGQSVTYNQAVGASTSTISQADADENGLIKFNTEGQAYADNNPSVKCIFKNTAKSAWFTRNNCAAGGTPESILYTVQAGKHSSESSQADADNEAQKDLNDNGYAYANANAKCTFKNTVQSRLIARNNCAPGGTPASVWYTVAAGIYSSTTSQADADGQAQREIDNNGQAFANNDANAKCTFKNTIQSRLIARNNCASGGTPASVWYTVAAGIYSSTTSQADADGQAQREIDNNGQAFANNDVNAKCTFKNTIQSRLIARNNCALGGIPASVWYTVAAGIYSSTTSQADADGQAQREIDNNGQAFANNDANAKCTFKNTVQSRLIARNNCAPGGIPASVWYTVAAGIYSSTISQADADAQAQREIDNNGQAFANNDANAKCTFKNTNQNRFITRNNCTAGGTPTTVRYTVPAGKYHSESSQADADGQAQREIDLNGEAFANTNGNCIFQSAAIPAQPFEKSDCTLAGIGSFVNYSLPLGAVTLNNTSQADVDGKAWTKFQEEGRANANANGYCTFRSRAISGSFQKAPCVSGAIGTYVGYALSEGAVLSNTSQAHADSEALTKLNAEGKANANANGQCLFYNVYTQRSIRRSYCPAGMNGTVVIYSVPAQKYSSQYSQADADRQAEEEIDRHGQGYADRNGECNEGAIEEQ